MSTGKDEIKEGWGPSEYSPAEKRQKRVVLLMVGNLAIGLISFFNVYFTPLKTFWLVNLFLYLFIYRKYRRIGIRPNIMVGTIILYLIIGSITLAGIPVTWIAFIAPCIYSSFAVLAIVSIANRRPFTLAYTLGEEDTLSLHWTTSFLWTVLYITAAISSFIFIPHLSFILVPFGLMVIGIFSTLFFHFHSLWPISRLPETFEYKGYTFFRISPDDKKKVEDFYELLIQQYLNEHRRHSKSDQSLSLEEIKKKYRKGDEKRIPYIHRFIAYDRDVPIGTVCVYIDHPVWGLQSEEKSGISCDSIKQCGRMGEIGKFSVARNYRYNQALIKGLFKCALDYLLSQGVVIVASYSFNYTTAMWRRFGFMPLLETAIPHPENNMHIEGSQMMPMIMNLSRMIFYSGSDADGAKDRHLLNSYYASRTFKRLVMKDFFLRSRSGVQDINETRLVEIFRKDLQNTETGLDGSQSPCCATVSRIS